MTVSLHMLYYNFARPHTSLSKSRPTTPEMEAGVSGRVWSLTDIAELLEPHKAALKA
jgi:hypothetical protein